MAQLDQIDVLIEQQRKQNEELNAALKQCRDSAAAILEMAEDLYGKPYPKAHGY